MIKISRPRYVFASSDFKVTGAMPRRGRVASRLDGTFSWVTSSHPSRGMVRNAMKKGLPGWQAPVCPVGVTERRPEFNVARWFGFESQTS
jgi:hypothetical protein